MSERPQSGYGGHHSNSMRKPFLSPHFFEGHHSFREADRSDQMNSLCERLTRAKLVTFDDEMLIRAKEVVPAQTPAECLLDNE